jgi:hypothetical protein
LCIDWMNSSSFAGIAISQVTWLFVSKRSQIVPGGGSLVPLVASDGTAGNTRVWPIRTQPSRAQCGSDRRVARNTAYAAAGTDADAMRCATALTEWCRPVPRAWPPASSAIPVEGAIRCPFESHRLVQFAAHRAHACGDTHPALGTICDSLGPAECSCDQHRIRIGGSEPIFGRADRI